VRRHRLASFSAIPQLARDGVLLHYSIGHADAHGRLAAIVDLLLRGANPAETPFELPDRTTCIVNRATAKAIGITLPAEILARATEIVG
jgi:putative ABC transport system substrate-binding protein